VHPAAKILNLQVFVVDIDYLSWCFVDNAGLIYRSRTPPRDL